MRKITKKQKEYILALVSRLEPEEVVSLSKEWDLNRLDEFSTKQASVLIQVLLKSKSKGGRK